MRDARKPFHQQRGASAVEFAIVAGLFFSLLIGAMEMGRLLFYWNTSVEATRLGARLAVVCDLGDAAIRSRMHQLLPLLPDSSANIQIDYFPSGCDVNTCQQITVGISGVSVQTLIPYAPLSIALPAFSTTLTRESMQSAPDDVANPVCTS